MIINKERYPGESLYNLVRIASIKSTVLGNGQFLAYVISKPYLVSSSDYVGEKLTADKLCLFVYATLTHTHTHTHIYIYIYIYIYIERERKRERE